MTFVRQLASDDIGIDEDDSLRNHEPARRRLTGPVRSGQKQYLCHYLRHAPQRRRFAGAHNNPVRRQDCQSQAAPRITERRSAPRRPP